MYAKDVLLEFEQPHVMFFSPWISFVSLVLTCRGKRVRCVSFQVRHWSLIHSLLLQPVWYQALSAALVLYILFFVLFRRLTFVTCTVTHTHSHQTLPSPVCCTTFTLCSVIHRSPQTFHNHHPEPSVALSFSIAHLVVIKSDVGFLPLNLDSAFGLPHFT